MKILKLILLFNFITLIGQNESLIGNWSGELSTGDGEIYGFDLELFEEEKELKGIFVWEILKPSNIKHQEKIGLIGIEHVKVYYNSLSRIVNFNRVKKEDPNNVINFGAYSSWYLYENGQVAKGINAYDAVNNNILYAKKLFDAEDVENEALTGQNCLKIDADFLKGTWLGSFSDFYSRENIFSSMIMEIDTVENNKFHGYLYNVYPQYTLENQSRNSKYRRINSRNSSLNWNYPIDSKDKKTKSYKHNRRWLKVEGEIVNDKIHIRIPDQPYNPYFWGGFEGITPSNPRCNDTIVYDGIYVASILDCNTISGFYLLDKDKYAELTAANRFFLQKIKPETLYKPNEKLVIKEDITVLSKTMKLKLLSDKKGENDIITLKLNGIDLLKNFRVPLTDYELLVPLFDGVNMLELVVDDDAPLQEKKVIVLMGRYNRQNKIILNSTHYKTEAIRITKDLRKNK